MNEQIKQLAQQSKLAELYDRYVEQCMKNADDDILDYDVIVKEFAKLLIEECIAQCWAVSELESNGYVVSECSKKIRKHFGVEE